MTGWRAEVEATLGPIARSEPVHGGSINDAYRVELVDGRRAFVKSHAAPPAGMYAAEAAGLAWLRPGPLRVPRVIAEGDRFLALEWLELDAGERGAPRFDEQLGRGLAGLHRLGAPTLGLAHGNFLATIPQDNTPEATLPGFWVERRLRPLIEQLRGSDGVPELRPALDALAAQPARFGPAEPIARLHGDLWWGNVATCEGAPVVFDPAVYGGHREIDLAMLALFGPVSDRLLAAYGEVWPLAAGWRERVAVWQLYPLAAHALLFGGSYVRRLALSLDALAGSR